MSILEGAMQTSLADGFTWIAILNVEDQSPPPGEKVIFEAGGPAGRPTFTVGLDENANLIFVITDVIGTRHVASVPADKLGRAPLYLACQLAPLARNRWRSTILLNDREAASEEFGADLGDAALVQQKVGGDLSGEKNAAFKLVEMLLVKSPLTGFTEPARNQLKDYFKQRYRLPL